MSPSADPFTHGRRDHELVSRPPPPLPQVEEVVLTDEEESVYEDEVVYEDDLTDEEDFDE